MRMLSHPNTVKLLERLILRRLCLYQWSTSAGETCSPTWRQNTEAEARGPFRQLVSALQHCHQRGMVLRDLKLGNLLLNANNNVKISHFVLNNQWPPGKKLDAFCGSPTFMAPELLLGMPYTGPEADACSLGGVLYTMVSRSLPFGGQDFWEFQQRVLRGQ